MLFNSLQFLVFFPLVLFAYFFTQTKYRWVLLLSSSYYFYMCWRPEFIILIIISTAIDYFSAIKIENSSDKKMKKFFLCISLISNLGLLFAFKYADFFGQTVNIFLNMFGLPNYIPKFNILLPVGISFYTFQTMSYTIDVFKGKMKAEKHFGYFALFVSFFPQLVAGPIEKSENLLPQLHKEQFFSYENATYGIKLMAIGFFKKVVVADNVAVIVDKIYNNVGNYSGGVLLIATMLFTMQIYCDFGGYSDIARGCAKTMGIDLMVNFRSPYFFSTSIHDYWRRNHISLSEWFTSYVYIPLGGGRVSHIKKYRNILITFFLSGLWHGANYTFLIWGLLQGVYLIIEDMSGKKFKNVNSDFVSIIITYMLSCFSLIFFRANRLNDAFYIINNIFYNIFALKNYMVVTLTMLISEFGYYMLAIIVFSIILLFIIDFINEKKDVILSVSSLPLMTRWAIYVGFVFIIILLIPKDSPAEFIYFQF